MGGYEGGYCFFYVVINIVEVFIGIDFGIIVGNVKFIININFIFNIIGDLVVVGGVGIG